MLLADEAGYVFWRFLAERKIAILSLAVLLGFWLLWKLRKK